MEAKYYPPLNLPQAKLKISRITNGYQVWCELRKKQLVLTPEEWVRQHVIHFLVFEKNISVAKIVSERLVVINGQNRRCDIMVVDEFGQPLLIVECKASDITVDEKTFLQTSNYVRQTKARYFWMTNGIQHSLVDCRNPEVLLEDFPLI